MNGKQPPASLATPVAAGASGAAADTDSSAELVSLYAKQPKIYPRSVSGRFARWRWIFVWLTQAIFYGGPWLQWNGAQALLFDIAERRFHLFGLVLEPQDLIFLAALLVIAALALFFFTAVAGRLWCGYACPQTVYSEIFLWIERRIEGDRSARIRLDAAPWSAAKLARKGGKHAAWLAVALVTGFSFVGYFTPVRVLLGELASFSLGPWESFWVLFYGAATYGNAGFMREQICKYMCPYARFQSTLIDADSLVIAYDAGRGEARGARRRRADPRTLGLGDCIDCKMCVQVCPTGIDIRNGLQNECIGCAACIDVCDDIMGKMGYAPGLIRYATENGVRQGWSRPQMVRRLLRPRVWVYGALLVAVSIAFVAALALRATHTVDVSRDRRAIARVVEGGWVENAYRLQVGNRGSSTQRFRLSARGVPGLTLEGPAEIEVAPHEHRPVLLQLRLPPYSAQSLGPGAHAIEWVVERDGARQGEAVRAGSTFFVPR